VADELGEQASEMSLADGVTLAGGSFEARAVEDDDAPVSAVDQSRTLQGADRERHCRTTDTQHDSDELLRQWEFVAAAPIARAPSPGK
jgi:hypothetical protein